MPRSSCTFAELLAIKPSQRTPEDVECLADFLADEPFFAGVSSSSLEVLSTCLTLQRAAPGEVVLHAGELTDRLIIILGGSLSAVRHSRKEGFQPQPPHLLAPGQTLCEASLVLSGRKSDLAVTVAAAAGTGSAGRGGQTASGAGSGAGAAGDAAAGGAAAAAGGAELAVVTRAAWSNMCARAPMKPEYGEARLAMLCCCARALAATDPAHRTLEQAEDLAALLRLLPGLSHTSPPVLRAMSESAYLRQLPAGTIVYEECTRGEAEFLVLSGAVETHVRPKRQGATNRAALRSALRSAVAAARVKSAKGGPKPLGGAAAEAPKTVRQKIEEERRAREEIKQSLALQREGLRTPPPRPQQGRSGAKAVEEEFKKWMLEFLSRKRAGDSPAQNAERAADAAKPSGIGTTDTSGGAGAKPPAPSKAISAWRRAAFKATHQEGEDPDQDGEDGAREEGGLVLKHSDTTLMEYERRKQEEAGAVKDVGNLLGGAAARKAYMRGLARDGGMYDEEPDDKDGAGDDDEDGRAGGVRWGAGAEDHADVVDIDDDDEEEDDPWVRLTFLDRRYRIVHKAIRYIDAVEKVMGIAKERGAQEEAAKLGSPGPAGKDGRDRDKDGDPDAERNPDDILLLLGANDMGAGDADGGREDLAAANNDADGPEDFTAANTAASSDVRGPAAAAAAAAGPGPGVEVDDACDEHLDQLYGGRTGSVDPGQLAGELPSAVIDRNNARAATRPRRAHSAIAGPSGADVLVVVLETLRRGHDAARDDLVSERLAMLTALEPLRGLSDENQAQLALGCTVVSYDANHVIVRQGQPVDALYVVQEGEVRLLDESESTLTAAAAAAATSPSNSAPGSGNAATQPGGAAAAVAAATAAAAGTPPESPFRSLQAAAGGGKALSIKTRRAAASLCALTLLGPGGSFGESVLGYPEDAGQQQQQQHGTAATATGDGGDGAGQSSSQFLATAMTTRATKLLVMSRSLLLKYAYLKTSLPPFAALRREAINGRRQQLKTSLQNRPAAAAGGLNVAVNPSVDGAAAAASASASSGGAAATNGTHSAHSGSLQLPVLSSPTALGAAVAYATSNGGAYQMPRPPPVRPAEVLEQLGFKPVMRRPYNGVSNKAPSSSSAAVAVVGTTPSPASSFTTPAGVAAANSALTGPSGGGSGGGAAAAAAAVASNVPVSIDRQRRADLLAASAFAVNAPQNLNNALFRGRAGTGGGGGDDSGSAHNYPSYALSLPVVNVYGGAHAAAAVASSAAAQTPVRRASADGSGPAATAAAPSGGAPPLQLPAAFTPSGQSPGGRGLPLRMSMSGLTALSAPVQHLGDGPGSPSPARRSSMSGLVLMNGGMALQGAGVGSPGGGGGGGGGGGAGHPGAHPSPPRGGRLIVGSTSGPTGHNAPSSSNVVLPRLSMPGNVGFGGMPLGGIMGTGQRPQPSRASGTEPFLTRLDAAGGGGGGVGSGGGAGSGGEGSPRSYSPVPLRRGSGTIGAVGVPGVGGGAGVLTSAPMPLQVMQQRSAGHSVARA